MTDEQIIEEIQRLAAELAARRKAPGQTAATTQAVVDWRAEQEWPPHPDLIDLSDPTWINMKTFAADARLSSPRAAYERVLRRPIAVKIGGVWYVNRTRALTPTGSLPGEKG